MTFIHTQKYAQYRLDKTEVCTFKKMLFLPCIRSSIANSAEEVLASNTGVATLYIPALFTSSFFRLFSLSALWAFHLSFLLGVSVRVRPGLNVPPLGAWDFWSLQTERSCICCIQHVVVGFCRCEKLKWDVSDLNTMSCTAFAANVMNMRLGAKGKYVCVNFLVCLSIAIFWRKRKAATLVRWRTV